MQEPQPIQKWIFIGSVPRSGTSLLQAMFNAHSRITSPPESHLWDRFVYAPRPDAKQAMQSYGSLRDFLDAHPKVKRLEIAAAEALSPYAADWSTFDPLAMYSRYLEIYATRKGKTVLAEGSPTNILNAELLNQKFPGSYMIHIVRDPRDVILSTLRADFTRGFLVTVPGLAEKFVEYYEAGMEMGPKIFGNRYVRVYYEDLCRQPEVELKRICEVVNEPFEPAMLEYYRTAGEVFAKEEMQWKKNLLQGVMSGNFGKWKKEMEPNDVLMVEYICKAFFKREKQYEISEYTRKWNPLKKQVYLMAYKLRKLRDKVLGRDWKKPNKPKSASGK